MANAIEKRQCKARQKIKRTKETEEIARDISAVFLGLSASVDTVHPTPECYWLCVLMDLMQICISTITVILFLILNISIIFDNFGPTNTSIAIFNKF